MNGLIGVDAPTQEVGGLRRASMTDRLKREKENLERRLSEINDVLATLEKNPGLQEALDKISQLGHF